MRNGLRFLRTAAAAALIASVFASPLGTPAPRVQAAVSGSWTTYHRDHAHTGNDSSLPLVNAVTTGWTSTTLDGQIYAEPLISNGVVYAATLNDTVYALDQSTGAVIWSKHVGTPQTTGWGCGNVSPTGILGTPVIDTAANRIYAVAEVVITGATTYHLFGLDLANSGNIVLNSTITSAGFDWTIEQERGALAVNGRDRSIPLRGR